MISHSEDDDHDQEALGVRMGRGEGGEAGSLLGVLPTPQPPGPQATL